MFDFCQCPRCGGSTFERLETYSHCVECLYFEDYWRGEDTDRCEAEKDLQEIEELDVFDEPQPEPTIAHLFSEHDSELMGA